MKVFSQLVSAQVENRTSDYSSGTNGRIWMRTDTSPVIFKVDDGSAIRTFVTTDNVQTLTNKTLTSPTLTTPTVDIPLFSQNSTPANPAANKDKLYFKSDDNLYAVNSAGTEIQFATTATAAPDQSYEISNLTLTCSVAANALTIAVKGKNGSDPSGSNIVAVGFRSSTSATGTYVRRTLTSALSLIISSGSTLGQKSAVASYIYVYAIDNAGTIELAVSSSFFDGGSRKSTSAEGGGGGATSLSVVYSTTARTSIGIRLIGRLSSNQTTAGTWAAVPTEASLTPFSKTEVSFINKDWTITPAATAFGTISGNEFRTKRIGDELYVSGFFVSGTLAAAAAKISIPTGLSIDTSKCFGDKKTWVGSYHTADDSTSNGFFAGTHTSGVVYINTGDTSNVYLTSTANGNTFEAANGNTLGANSDSFFYWFSIPISEWA